jgi:hypothetical protein
LTATKAGAGYAVDLMPQTSVPRLEAGSIGAVVGCGHTVAGQEEEVVDRIVGGQEALSLSGRLEPLHRPFSSSGRLV